MQAPSIIMRCTWKSNKTCLSVFASVYVIVNLVLMDRSAEVERYQAERHADNRPKEEETGWWLPRPSGFIVVNNEVHTRHLLSEDGLLKNGSLPRNLSHEMNSHEMKSPHTLLSWMVPSQLRKVLEQSSRCDRVSKVGNLAYLASGWTKAVYRGQLENRDVAVKMADKDGHDVRRCVKMAGLTAAQCRKRVEDKVLKEGFILNALDNPHIVRLLDVCVTSSEAGSEVHSGPLLVTELGEMVDIVKLLQMSWEDRLRLTFGLSKLLHYLANSRYGSIVINDFRLQQFVLIDGELKLSDVDDAGFDEPICSNSDDCQTRFPSSNVTIKVPCYFGRCVGLNEKKNTANAGRHFVSVLLPHGVPSLRLRALVDRIVDAYTTAELNASELLDLTTRLVQSYSNGSYLQRRSESIHSKYKRIDDSDLPDQFDYRCRYSIATSGCTVSAFDEKEAEDFCEFDSQCQVFVISGEKTWTGRFVARLKNNASIRTIRSGVKLYVRQNS